MDDPSTPGSHLSQYSTACITTTRGRHRKLVDRVKPIPSLVLTVPDSQQPGSKLHAGVVGHPSCGQMNPAALLSSSIPRHSRKPAG